MKQFDARTRDVSVAVLRPAPQNCRLLGCVASNAPIGVGVCASIDP